MVADGTSNSGGFGLIMYKRLVLRTLIWRRRSAFSEKPGVCNSQTSIAPEAPRPLVSANGRLFIASFWRRCQDVLEIGEIYHSAILISCHEGVRRHCAIEIAISRNLEIYESGYIEIQGSRNVEMSEISSSEITPVADAGDAATTLKSQLSAHQNGNSSCDTMGPKP